MSISITSGVMIPVSVVEVGNEITQDQLNAITAATLPSVGNVFITQSLLTSSLTPYAFIASPTFTGTPTLPTGTIGVTQSTADNSTKLATTAFVKAQSYLTTTTAASTYQTISGMTSYAPKASPTFTGTVTIPAGASISGYLTTANASSTYQTISGMSSYLTTANAINIYAPKLNGSEYPVVYDVPMDGVEYVRKNQSWVTATGGGGGLTISTLSNAATSTLNATAPTTGQALTFNGTELIWATVGGGGISDAPVDGVLYGRLDGAWSSIPTYLSTQGYATQSWVTSQNYAIAKTVQSVGTGYLVQVGDQNKILLFTTTMGGDTINLPADSTYAFPDGTEITVCQYSGISGNGIAGQYAGQPTINGAWNVSVTQTVSKLVKIATNTWLYT